MLFTAGVGSTDEVFSSFFVDFQIVGDAFAVQPITKSQSIRWMVKTKIFHEILAVTRAAGGSFLCLRHQLNANAPALDEGNREAQ
jgi:hypothetical protein